MMKKISEKGPSKSASNTSANTSTQKAEELKTEPPISEKDEVKKAERTLQNNRK